MPARTAAFYSAAWERWKNAPSVRKTIFARPPKKRREASRDFWNRAGLLCRRRHISPRARISVRVFSSGGPSPIRAQDSAPRKEQEKQSAKQKGGKLTGLHPFSAGIVSYFSTESGAFIYFPKVLAASLSTLMIFMFCGQWPSQLPHSMQSEAFPLPPFSIML